MRNQCLRFGVAVATLLSGWSAQAFGFDVSLDWKVRNVYVTPSPTVEGPVTIGCRWRATVVTSFFWNETISWSGMFLVDGKDAGSFTVSYPPSNETYNEPSEQGWDVNIAPFPSDSAGTASNEFNGYKPSPTPIRARISDRNKAPQSVVQNVSLPRPKLTASIISSSIDATCNNPYNIAKVKVSVHADFPLGANRGWVKIYEPGKTEFLSGKAELPAIGAGSSVPITVGLATVIPPSWLVGNHNVVVLLEPKPGPGGSLAFDPPATAPFAAVSFPPGYCPSARAIPPPQGGRRLQPAAPKTTPPARRSA